MTDSKPTAKQLDYLKRLALRERTTFETPTTWAEASALIDRLKRETAARSIRRQAKKQAPRPTAEVIQPSPDRVAQLQAMPYEEYLLTPHWRKLRKKVRSRACGRCEQCGKPTGPTAEVHHLNYDRLGCERLTDLRAVCPSCHEAEHWPGEAK